MLLFHVLLSQAQTDCRYRITGLLLNPSDSTGLPHAEIFIEQGHIRSKTDVRGYFRMDKVCGGVQILEIDKPGYRHLHAEITVRRDTFITLMAEASAGQHDTVRIHAAREKSEALQVSGRDILNSAGDDLSRVALKIPGMELLQGGRNQAKPMARGMYGLRLPVFTDRIRLEGQAWGNDHNPEADARSFDHIELVKDASVLRLAHDAPGGALLLAHQAQPHNGESNLDQALQFSHNGRQLAWTGHYTRKASAEAPDIYANAAFRKAGNYATPDVLLDNTGLEEYSFAAGRRKSGPRGYRRLDLSAYRFEGGLFPGSRAASTNDLMAAINRDIPLTNDVFRYRIDRPRQAAGHASVQWTDHRVMTDGYREWTIGLQYDQRREFDFHRSSLNKFPQLDLILFSPAVNYTMFRRLRAGLTLTAGNQFTGHIHRYGGFYFLPDFKGITNGTFGLLHLHHRKLTHTLGIRLDGKWIQANVRENGLNSLHTRQFADVSLAYSGILPAGKHHVHWHLSRLWRAPWVNELYSQGVHHGSAAFELGNKFLNKEVSYRAEAEWQYEHRNLKMYVSPYINYYADFINLTPMSAPVLTIRGAFPGYEYLQDDALFAGADVNLKWIIGQHWQWNSRFSYIYAGYTGSGRYPAFIPPARMTHDLAWNTGRFHIRLKGEYVFRQKYFNPGSDLLPPPSAYFLADAEAGIRDPRASDRYDVMVGVNNAFNRRYRSYLDRFRYFSDMPGRNIYIRLNWRIHHHTENHH